MEPRQHRLMILVSAMTLGILFHPGSAALAQTHSPSGLELPQIFRGSDNSDPGSDTPWWESFDDAVLTELVGEAMAANHDVASATARLDAAGERVVQTRAPLLPNLNLDASLNATPSNAQTFQTGGSGSIPGSTLPDVIGNGSALLTLSYQFDLFGRQVEALRASRDNEAAAEDDRDALAATVASQVAEAYFDVLAAQEQLEIIDRQVTTQESMLELTQSRYEQSDAAASDVLQQRQQIASTRSNRPVAEATLRRALQRLALLRGETSYATTQARIPESARLPQQVPPPPATGRPIDLLENRPDLRAAQARLDAAQHQRRSRSRAALPTLGISGSAGGSLFIGDEADTQATWSVGTTLSVPLFRGLSNVAATREARATVREAEHLLDQGLLQASSDVEGALAAERENRAQLAEHQRMLEAAEQAYTVARRSYAGGIGNYLSVMTALATFQASELTVLQSRRNVLSARTQLYQALGGQWTQGLGSRGEGGR